MRVLTASVLLALVSASAAAAPCQSVRSGDWNAPGTWAEGRAPQPKGGDVVVIAAGHEVAIPAGIEAVASGNLAAGAADQRTTLVVHGKLTLDGDLSLNDRCDLRLMPGATLDLAGHKLLAGLARLERVALRFLGEPKRRVTVTSSQPGGAVVTGSTASADVDFRNTDFTRLGDCRFGSRAGAAEHCRVSCCSFDGNGDLAFVFGEMPDANDALFEGCDFRNPAGAKAMLLDLSCGGDKPTGKRLVSDCTFLGAGKPAVLRTIAAGLTVDHCVFEDAAWQSFQKGGQKIRSSFLHTSVHNCLVLISHAWGPAADTEDCYVFADGRNPHSLHAADGATVRGCVFEATDPECNHVIPSKGVTIERNIVLGAGTLCTGGGVNTGAVVVRRNTVYATRTGPCVPMLILTEGLGNKFAGGCVARNNLLVDADTTDAGDCAVGLVEPDAGQIKVDYNDFFGYPGGDVRLRYHIWHGKHDPSAAIVQGGHDLNVDPKFVDRSRNLAAWDKSLGGPGTPANAIRRLLDREAKYNIDGLLDYIRKGFTPQANALDNAGDGADGSPDIGAIDFGRPAAPR